MRKIKISQEQREEIIKQAQENFWEQKSDEILTFLIWALLIGAILFALCPLIGLAFQAVAASHDWTIFKWGTEPATYYTQSYWPCVIMGFVICAWIVVIIFLIYGICELIKSWINSNIELAYKRALEG